MPLTPFNTLILFNYGILHTFKDIGITSQDIGITSQDIMKTYTNQSQTLLRFQHGAEEKIIPPGEQEELEINSYIQGLIDQGILVEVKIPVEKEITEVVKPSQRIRNS